jgi:hypothetical protein
MTRQSNVSILGLVASFLVAAGGGSAVAPSTGGNRFDGMAYRMIGSHRGGRSTAVAGIAGDHRTFGEDKPTSAATDRWHELKTMVDERLAAVRALIPGAR